MSLTVVGVVIPAPLTVGTGEHGLSSVEALEVAVYLPRVLVMWRVGGRCERQGRSDGGGKEGSDMAMVGCDFRIWAWPGRPARWAHNHLISISNKATMVQWT